MEVLEAREFKGWVAEIQKLRLASSGCGPRLIAEALEASYIGSTKLIFVVLFLGLQGSGLDGLWLPGGCWLEMRVQGVL